MAMKKAMTINAIVMAYGSLIFDQMVCRKGLAKGISKNHAEGDLNGIKGKEGPYADSQCCRNGVIQLQYEPDGTKYIANSKAKYHTGNLEQDFLGAVHILGLVNEDSGDQCHQDEADEITAGRSKKLSGTALEGGKHRQTNKAKKQIDHISQRTQLCL